MNSHLSTFWLSMLLACLLAPWTMAEVYKTVDKDGRVIYSDSPKTDNAERIKLRELNTVPSPDAIPQYQTNRAPAVVEDEGYEIHIISPRHEVTIPVGQRDLAIAINLNRELQADHLLVYFMDGELIEETRMTNILIKDVMRGTHVISVEAIDADGQSLGTSEPVTVNLIRPIIKKPASPTPKPSK